MRYVGGHTDQDSLGLFLYSNAGKLEACQHSIGPGTFISQPSFRTHFTPEKRAPGTIHVRNILVPKAKRPTSMWLAAPRHCFARIAELNPFRQILRWQAALNSYAAAILRARREIHHYSSVLSIM